MLHLREDYTARRVQRFHYGEGVADAEVNYTRCSCGSWSSSHQDERVRSLAYVAHVADVCTVPELAGILARARHQAEAHGHARVPKWEELPPSVWEYRTRQAMPYAAALHHLLTGG